jgi:hypothetical protein
MPERFRAEQHGKHVLYTAEAGDTHKHVRQTKHAINQIVAIDGILSCQSTYQSHMKMLR